MLTELIKQGAERIPATKFIRYDNGQDVVRENFMTSSQAHDCPRKIFLDRSNSSAVKTALEENWGILSRGTTAEDFIVKCIRHSPTKHRFKYLGKDQVTFISGNRAGTPDGLMYLSPNFDVVRVLEFKCIDPRLNKSNLPKPEHVTQVIQNISLVRAALGDSVEVSSVAHLIYVNAADYGDITEIKVLYDRDVDNDLVAKAQLIREADKPSDLPALGLYNNALCKYCKHTASCSSIEQRKRGQIRDDENIKAHTFFETPARRKGREDG